MQYLATSMPRWRTVLLIFLSLASGNRSFPASRAWEIFAMDHDAGDVADAAAFTASRARRKKSPTAQASWPAQPNSLIAAEIAPIKGHIDPDDADPWHHHRLRKCTATATAWEIECNTDCD
jgi:hypothetical protein